MTRFADDEWGRRKSREMENLRLAAKIRNKIKIDDDAVIDSNETDEEEEHSADGGEEVEENRSLVTVKYLPAEEEESAISYFSLIHSTHSRLRLQSGYLQPFPNDSHGPRRLPSLPDGSPELLLQSRRRRSFCKRFLGRTS
ncbi:hypothetical protein NE237_007021 [Protea cynaroides]|uniref:Uncharacterized protein n=1 Tax=Protea cynaroides TaxID=273540 RepID=A0A9Q0KNL6_9MAGN|nr:hypothetical protein NE237_007021 [Protea cynaroides]